MNYVTRKSTMKQKAATAIAPPFLKGMASLITRKHGALKMGPGQLPARLTAIKTAHAKSVDAVKGYADATYQSYESVSAELEKMLAHRLAAAESKHLPDALLAAELAAAEREAVVTAIRSTLANIAALSERSIGVDLPTAPQGVQGPAQACTVPMGSLVLQMNNAVEPLLALLAVLPTTEVINEGSAACK